MKISIIGGGAWGATLGQLLIDNNHSVLIYDINQTFVEKINNEHIHPFFGDSLSHEMKATSSLDEALSYANYLLLAVPTKVMRSVLKMINEKITEKKYFINVSKGIEPDTFKRVSEIVEAEIDFDKLGGFAVLTGPSHAEEVIKRKLTLLTVASKDQVFAEKLQVIFSNDTYMRVYTSDDLIGCEVGGAAKNAIAVVSGIATGLNLGENARAALITRGILEIVRIVEVYGGNRDTAFGLTGVGDLIVTASSENSRNFKAGKKIGEGMPIEDIFSSESQTIEGVRSIYALHQLSVEKNINLPIISTAYKVIYEGLTVKEAISNLVTRTLKSEIIE